MLLGGRCGAVSLRNGVSPSLDILGRGVLHDGRMGEAQRKTREARMQIAGRWCGATGKLANLVGAVDAITIRSRDDFGKINLGG